MQHLTDEQINDLKSALEEERATLETILNTEAHVDEDGDWVTDIPEADDSEQDPTVQADRFEEMYNNGGSVAEMEARLASVSAALERILDGSYGISRMSNEPIEFERLEANPAADLTAKEARNEGPSLDDQEALIE